jgi:hypothetical protein
MIDDFVNQSTFSKKRVIFVHFLPLFFYKSGYTALAIQNSRWQNQGAHYEANK